MNGISKAAEHGVHEASAIRLRRGNTRQGSSSKRSRRSRGASVESI